MQLGAIVYSSHGIHVLLKVASAHIRRFPLTAGLFAQGSQSSKAKPGVESFYSFPKALAYLWENE